MCFAIWVKLYYICNIKNLILGITNMTKGYKVGTRTFTEEDFKNPPPLEEMSLEYKIAYGDWAFANGLSIEFESAEEATKWIRDRYEKND
jgi:hypothetical protein